MISTQVHFWVDERTNSFYKSGKEWALHVQLVGYEPWVITTWDSKPSTVTIATTKTIVMRSFEFYHRHLRIPTFKMEDV